MKKIILSIVVGLAAIVSIGAAGVYTFTYTGAEIQALLDKVNDISDLPISGPVQAALDAKIDSVGSCTDGDCPASDILADLIGLESWNLSSLSIQWPESGWTFQSLDHSPDIAGRFLYDNTVAGLAHGAMAWMDSNNTIRYFADVSSPPTKQGQVLAYNAATDKWEPGFAKVYIEKTFDPKTVCDGDIDRLFVMDADDGNGNAFVADKWKVSFLRDPATEVDLDLKRADALIGVANSAVIDVLDTTAGTSSESTAANINGGAAVANGKIIYLEFGTAYVATGEQCTFRLWGHYE